MTQTVTGTLNIVNKRGLHARASSKFAMMVGEYPECTVRVSREDQEVDGESIMDLMMLAAGNGSQIDVSVSGPRAHEALEALAALVADRFGEGE
jgi:phosphocarrier protein HPr